MKKILNLLEDIFKEAFKEAGYDEKYAMVSVSNREDLCEYQCNGSMPAAKEYRKAPIMIANDVVEKLQKRSELANVTAAPPGFINFDLSESFLSDYLTKMNDDENTGIEQVKSDKTIVIDYGGPNVAKALHIGHLRSAIIGESLKRISRRLGHKVVGDVHLGDWGLQMGLIISELKLIKPDLPYFKDDFSEEKYKDEIKDAPFTIKELGDIYPRASAKSKEDEAFYKEALEATKQLQNGNPGYRAIFKHIIDVSVTDLKENYRRLNVDFDLWLGESDVQSLIPDMIEMLKDKKLAHLDNQALVVDVKKDDDKKEIPPCIIQKSDGSSLYATTDLATLVMRNRDFDLEKVIYVVDKRQDLHFTQVFRVARLAEIVKPDTELEFLGFGTICSEGGTPLKSRDGGTMKLETLLDETAEKMYSKIVENRDFSEEEAKEIAEMTAVAAIKYGDLSNQPAKNYIYNADRFTSYEGNTGPYILYTIVRIKSILKKYEEKFGKYEGFKLNTENLTKEERKLMTVLARFNSVVEESYDNLTLHRLCGFIYEVAEAFNRLYHEVVILKEEDKEKREGYISLLKLTKRVLEEATDMLGIKVPERM